MGGDVKKNYNYAILIVDTISNNLNAEKEKLNSMSDSDNKLAQQNKIKSLEDQLKDWKKIRDKLKKEVEKVEKIEKEIAKEQQLAAAANMAGPEGVIASQVIEQDIKKKQSNMRVISEKDKSESRTKLNLSAIAEDTPFEEIPNQNSTGLVGNSQVRRTRGPAFSQRPASSRNSTNNEFNSQRDESSANAGWQNNNFNNSNFNNSNSTNSNSSRRPSKIGGFFKAAGSIFSNGNKKLKDKIEDLSNGEFHKQFLIESLFLFAIIVHLVDAFIWNFSMSQSVMINRVMAYLLLSMFACIVLNVNIFFGLLTFFCVVSFIPVFLIPILSNGLNALDVTTNVKNIIGTIFLAIPVWLIYLKYYLGINLDYSSGKASSKGLLKILLRPSKWVGAYFILLALFFIFWLMSTIVVPSVSIIPGSEDTGFNPTASVEIFTEFVSVTWKNGIDAINGIGKDLKGDYKAWKNDTMSSYYTGQVEQNTVNTGVFITDFHLTGTQYDSMPVVAYGYVRARSFVDNVTIKTSCYAQSTTNKSVIYQGVTDPPILENIYIEDQRGVICTFEKPGNDGIGTGEGLLPAGRYQIFLKLEFDLETWAYKPYFFIDRNYLVYLRTSGENPVIKLGIPQKTKTIYTSGPVMIGMDDALEMPFAISSESNNYLPLGMTIDDKPSVNGAKGEVVRVHNYTLRMPNYFTVNKCTAPVEPTIVNDELVPGYKIYTFKNTNQNLNLSGSFMTLNCNVEISKEKVSQIIPGANTPAITSIVGTVHYDYKLTKQIPLTVQKTPGAQ